ncbi:hypothetical protein BBP40_000615 [Aspergillus hancockii]|nr:hypothetical protein BBP40_000615 [Aspergillus hancockii]
MTTPGAEMPKSNDIRVLNESDQDFWYFAYGSNMRLSTMTSRGITPLSTEVVEVATHYLTFDIFGIPYSEPSYASVAEFPVGRAVSVSVTSRDQKRPVPAVVGVAYLLSPADRHRLLVSEGSGVVYDWIQVEAEILNGERSGKIVAAWTLRAKHPVRPNGVPSTRYMGLFLSGAEENALPQPYLDYLSWLPSYTPTKGRDRPFGQYIFEYLWRPFLKRVVQLTTVKVDDMGNCSPVLARLIVALYNTMWKYHDTVHVRIFAILERALQNAGEAIEALQSPDLSEALGDALHDPNELPDSTLQQLSADVVDRLENLQMLLIPSVSLLADGFFGYLLTKALWTAIDARVADVLQEHGPLPASSLGDKCGVQGVRLSQVLDTLVNFGIFSYDAKTSTYSNNRASAMVTHDHWTQWHRWSDLYGTDIFDVSRAMPASIKTGETRSAAQIAYNTDLSLFEHFAAEGRIAKFHATLGAGAVAQAPGLSVDYPWEEVANETVVDIGAGSGEFLASVMRAHPPMRGVYFDLPHAVEMVRPHFEQPGGKFADLADRMTALVPGSFMEKVPASSVYTMKWCLHDWLDEDVVRILQTIRAGIVVSPVEV